MSFNDFKNVLVSTHNDFRRDDNSDVLISDIDRIVRKNARSVLAKVYNQTSHKDETFTKNFLEQEIAWSVEDRDHAVNLCNEIKIAVTKENLEVLLSLYEALNK